jgi:hypothetical protein
MAEPIARFRLFERSDDKEVRFIIGKSNMEPLAVANQRGKFSFQRVILYHIEFIYFLPTSVLSPLDHQFMVRVVLYLHRVHELVAQFP